MLSLTSRLVLAILVGRSLEFYVFAVFSQLGPFISPLFWPSANADVKGVDFWTAYALAFAARPVGALLFGHLGDRHSRKRSLTWALMLQCGATVGMACLPTYQHIGRAAPALLDALRFLQGLAQGGQGGCSVVLLFELLDGHQHRYLLTQVGYAGIVPGAVIGIAVVLALQAALSHAHMQLFGWRIALLGGLLTGLLGAYVRRVMPDPALFVKRKQAILEALSTREFALEERRRLGASPSSAAAGGGSGGGSVAPIGAAKSRRSVKHPHDERQHQHGGGVLSVLDVLSLPADLSALLSLEGDDDGVDDITNAAAVEAAAAHWAARAGAGGASNAHSDPSAVSVAASVAAFGSRRAINSALLLPMPSAGMLRDSAFALPAAAAIASKAPSLNATAAAANGGGGGSSMKDTGAAGAGGAAVLAVVESGCSQQQQQPPPLHGAHPGAAPAAGPAAARRHPKATYWPWLVMARHYWLPVVLQIGYLMWLTASFFLFVAWWPATTAAALNVPLTATLLGTAGALVLLMLVQWLMGALCDGFGGRLGAWRLPRLPAAIAVLVLAAATAVPMGLTMHRGGLGAAVAWQHLLAALTGAVNGLVPPVVCSLFPPEARLTSVSFAQQLTMAALGGTVPLMLTGIDDAISGDVFMAMVPILTGTAVLGVVASALIWWMFPAANLDGAPYRRHRRHRRHAAADDAKVVAAATTKDVFAEV